MRPLLNGARLAAWPGKRCATLRPASTTQTASTGAAQAQPRHAGVAAQRVFAQRPARPPAVASLRSAPCCNLPGYAGPARRQGAHRLACLEAFFCFFRSAAFRRFSRSRSAAVSFRSLPFASGPLACGCAPCAAPSGPSMLPFASASTATDSSRTMLGPAAGPPSASRPPRTQEKAGRRAPDRPQRGLSRVRPGLSRVIRQASAVIHPEIKRVCPLRRLSPPMTHAHSWCLLAEPA